MTGILTLWASPWARAGHQSATANGVQRLTDKIAVVNAGGTNVVAFSTGDGLLLVDSGAPGYGDQLVATLNGVASNSSVGTLFNTHYHLENTGNNERFGASGATIIAHDRTRHWMSTDYWLPAENRYEPARPKAAWPTQSFLDNGSMEAGGEQIDYGYLLVAHTGGDMYVHFTDSNVLAVGDVASPVRDPELDWITGGWIGGRVDAMDLLLEIGNEDTMIAPGTGPVMTYAEFKAERELMEVVRQRLFKQIRAGDGS
jgi:glyoxylase-like metal-dependent hydrolase (beta-lactamase superfamily II)